MLARIFNRGYSFANINEVLSVFQYGGTSCEHPIKTINEDMKIAANNGLSTAEVVKYKLKHIPINIAKIILSKLHIWGVVYRIIKRKSVLEN